MTARKNATATDLALPDSGSALSVLDDLTLDASGLEEVDAEDLRFSSKVWNLRGKRPDGKGLYQVDEFLDTLTEETVRELRCVFVALHKTNDYSFFDNALNETVRVCSSYDRVTGTLLNTHPGTGEVEGSTRPCERCPDAQWRKVDGKNVRPCATVYGVIAVEIDEANHPRNPFMVRFKKTSLAPFKAHLQKHHIRRRQDPKTRKMVDVPLFAFPVLLRLEADEGGQFAVPVIERGPVLPRDLIVQLSEQAKGFRELADDVTRMAETKETLHEAGDASISANDFADE